MARPRRQFSGQETIELKEVLFLEEVAPGALGVRQRQRWEKSRDWAYRTPNGVYDPLTYLFILDSLANIEPSIELRAKNLALWLNRAVRQFRWDPVTVGKVLRDLQEAFEDKFGRGQGLLIGGKDYRGAFYLIQGTPETAAMYRGLREDLMKLARNEITQQELGQHEKRLASPLLECPTARGEWVEVDA